MVNNFIGYLQAPKKRRMFIMSLKNFGAFFNKPGCPAVVRLIVDGGKKSSHYNEWQLITCVHYSVVLDNLITFSF